MGQPLFHAWRTGWSITSQPSETTGIPVNADTLVTTDVSNQRFENPNGTPIVVAVDFFDRSRSDPPFPGPVENGGPQQQLRIWSTKTGASKSTSVAAPEESHGVEDR